MVRIFQNLLMRHRFWLMSPSKERIYMKPIYLISLLSLVLCTYLHAQEAHSTPKNSIEGFAPDYTGQIVEILMYEDYITKTTKLLATDEVSNEDSTFNVQFNNPSTKEIIIKIDDVESHIYAQPGAHYEVYIPPLKAREDPDEKLVTAQIFGLDEKDINYKITSFDMWVDDFLSKHALKIMDTAFIAELDTFSNYIQDYYKDETDPYFLTYVRYSLGDLQMMEKTEDENMKRFLAYVGYIRKFPIIYGHPSYMRFVSSFYKQMFNRFSKEDEEKIYKAVVKSSPTLIHNILKKDKTLENVALRELTMIQELGRAYHEKVYPQQMILNILDSIQSHPEIEYNAKIASNIYNKLTEVTAGNKAPVFNVKDVDGNRIKLEEYSGRYVYLTFFSAQNPISTREIKLISAFNKKYGKDIDFISIAVGDDQEDLKKFLNENPTINWTIGRVDKKSDLVKDYNVRTVPSYYLIAPDGYFIQAPALGPAPNSEYMTIDYQLHEIYQKLNPSKRIKVGEK